MIKLIVLIFFAAIMYVVADSILIDNKLKHVDKLVSRGIDPEEAVWWVYK